MARVTGPLFSVDASGTVAGAVVFSRWKGRSYVRKHAIPSNPNSVKQVSVRAALRFLSQAWSAATVGNKASWLELAEATKISNFNAYLQHNMRLHRSMLPFTIAYPAAAISTAGSAPTLAVTAGVRCLTIVATKGANKPTWGYIFFRAAAAPAGTFDQIVRLLPIESGDTVTFVDSPLVAGTYHYKGIGFNLDGKLGTLSADANGTATD